MGLLTKEGVVFKSFNPYNLWIINAALSASNLMGRDIVITSANDGVHQPASGRPSFHYLDRALDFRTKDMTSDEKEKFKAYMSNQLSTAYDIVQETNPEHLHVEADRV